MRLLVTPTSAHPPADLNNGPLLDPSKFTARMFDSSTYYKGGIDGLRGLRGLRGLGQTSTAMTAASVAASGATATAAILVAFGAITGPVGLAIGAIVGIAPLIVKLFSGCGQTCTQATQYANQVEPILNQNLQAYISSPVRTVSMQQAAINNYNTAIASLKQACGQAALGSAGQNCIDERVNASSCQWKASPGGWVQNSDGTCTYTPWGASGSGNSCWNWVIGYYNPIANDPCVVPDSAVLSPSSSSSSTSSAGATNTGTSPSTTSTGATSDLLSSLTSDITIGSLEIPLWMLLAGGAALLLL